jgi:[ribosomal protein S18]-alanine N-acetyltransferase
MRTRRAVPEDIPALIALESRAATAAHWTTDQYEAVFSSETPSRVILIAEETGVQGFMVGRAVGEEWEIENLAVAGPARRRGVGTRLLGEFLSSAREQRAQAVFLEVRESNLAARRLYEKLSFVEAGRRKRYYHEPEEDAIVYRLGWPDLHQP